MRQYRLVLLIGLICLASGWFFVGQLADQGVAHAQQTSAPAEPVVLRAETRLVLVDTVVTDKKGTYVSDLEQKDFKVWEDGKEQVLSSFSYEDSSDSHSQPHYMVLFFDNSTMDFSDQIKARDAAAKFIDANAGPNRLIAIADFGGTVRISQNFTADAQRLKQVVKNTKGSSVQPNGQPDALVASLATPPVGPSLARAESEFGIQSVLSALRSMAKGLSTVPGRKTLVMLTSGFPLNIEDQSQLTATMDTCNKANVAIYPIDVRGLVVPDMPKTQSRSTLPSFRPESRSLIPAAFHYSETDSGFPRLRFAAFAEPVPFFWQHGGGGGTGGGGGGHGGGGGSGGGGGGGVGGGGGKGGGGTGGGGTGVGGRPGGGGLGQPFGVQNPYQQPRVIVPSFPTSTPDNQQVLYQLADGTGGFVILNTNDLVGGLDRIARDSNQYYLLGYKPEASAEGSCHTLKVKVERGGTKVRARSGYCNVKPVDLLAGNPIEKDLENRAQSEMKGDIVASMRLPFFYTAPDTAQVHLALDIPPAAFQFEKVKGKQHAAVNVLGIAYKPDGSIAARFSDTANIDLDDKKEMEEFQKQPFHYENQFAVASGQYKLRVVFSSGNQSFGKLEAALVIDPYGERQFSLSGVALSDRIRPAADASTELDGELLEDKTPLLANGAQFSPSASNRFKKTDSAAIYAEVYEPLLKNPNPPEVAYEMIIVERKTGAVKVHIGDRTPKGKAGNPVIALGLKLPIASLSPGSYRLDLRAVDSLNNFSKTRSADFEVE